MLKRLVINGRRAGRKKRDALISAFNSRKIRTEKGGYIFKAGSDDDNLYIGILPCIIEGERTHHYDIELPPALTEILIGSLTAEGIFSLLFVPKQKTLADEELVGYRRVYMDFASSIVNLGLNISGKIDEVTVLLLRTSGVIPEAVSPFTLDDISRL